MSRLRGWGSPYEGQASVLRLTDVRISTGFGLQQGRLHSRATDWTSLARDPQWQRSSGALLLLHKHREQAAFAVEVMIPRRQDCEGDRRSWRIAIWRCDAVAHNFVAFSRKPLLRPLESSSNFSPHFGTGNALSSFAIHVL